MNRRSRENVEAGIRAQAARTLVQLFDNLYEGAFAIDRAANIVWMNHKFKALIGWNGTEPVEGKPIEEILPESNMRHVVESGQANLLDILEFGERHLVVSRLPLTGEDGRITGAMGVILYDRIQALTPLIAKIRAMQDDLATTRRQLAAERRAKYSFSHFIGVSPEVKDLKNRARRAADLDTTVLLLGETGTGKELLAHAIHAASPRALNPMVRVNVAAIPENLLESELFGTAPGAYTGADRKGRDGKFMVADRGTLFLDEIGDMPGPLQAKLLRVMQEREVEPLGSNKVLSVDVRIIAATSRDLKKMVEDGSFRADLYYRLNVLPLTSPPLREHPQDIEPLCEALLEKMAAQSGATPRSVTADAVNMLMRYHWPGNVRELSNILEQASARHDARELSAEHFADIVPVTQRPPKPADETATAQQEDPIDPDAPVRALREVLAEAEHKAIRHALEAAGGVKSRAAKMLGISRAQFYEKLANMSEPSGIPDR